MTRLTMTILLIALMAIPVFAADQTAQPGEIGKALQQDDLKTYKLLREYTDLRFAASDFQDFPLTNDFLGATYRSPGKSFLYSMLIPGSGQLYTQSKFKAGVFMGIEVASWAVYYIYHKKGQNQTDDNNIYADANWSPERYTNWLIETYGITSDTATFIGRDGNDARFTHHLPTTKTQQYYEMIGKYNQFQYGWVGTDYLVNDSTTEFRKSYLNDRAKANDEFDRAKLGAIVSLANHLLSAFDAALSAKRYNKKQDSFTELSLQGRLTRYEGHQLPKLIVSYRF